MNDTPPITDPEVIRKAELAVDGWDFDREWPAEAVRPAAERPNGVAWSDAYLRSESAFRAPMEKSLIEPPTPALKPNRAERRARRRSR
jgi:hypothetical protein